MLDGVVFTEMNVLNCSQVFAFSYSCLVYVGS